MHPRASYATHGGYQLDILPRVHCAVLLLVSSVADESVLSPSAHLTAELECERCAMGTECNAMRSEKRVPRPQCAMNMRSGELSMGRSADLAW